MLFVGHQSKFKNPNVDFSLNLIEDNILIFGPNESGKTTFFKKINKVSKNYYYKKWNDHIILISNSKVGFINQNGKVSKIKRMGATSFSKASIIEMTKMNCSIYRKWLKENGKNSNPNLMDKIKIKGVNLANQKNYFDYFEYTYKDFKKILLQTKKKILELENEKDRKGIMNSIFMHFWIRPNRNINSKDFIPIIKQMRHMDVDKKTEIYVKICDKASIDQIFLFLKQIYRSSFYKTIKLMNIEDKNNHQNKIVKGKIKFALVTFRTKGKSFGARRLNNIINSISELMDSGTSKIVIDDPFDGLSQDNKIALSNLFIKLMNLNVEFLILTNDIFSFQYLRNEINCNTSKKISTAILKKYDENFLIDDITQIDNILFKWNDKKYYNDIKKFIKRHDVNYEIACLLLSTHSEVIQDFKYLSNLFVDDDKRENEIKKLYDLVIEFAKSENFPKLFINPKIKENKHYKWNLRIRNATISKMMPLFQNITSELTYKARRELFFIIQSLKSILLINLYDILDEKIKNHFGIKPSFVEELKNRKEFLKHIKKIMKENRRWRNSFKHRGKFPLINALYYPEPTNDLMKIFQIYSEAKIEKLFFSHNPKQKFENWNN